MTDDKAYFGGGCFWCTEAVFERLKGVIKVEPGYAGGATPNPSYESVSSGMTGHAEVIEVTYNPKIITYDQLLSVFWESHDPTSLNRQGNDVGSQYRSIIFYSNDEQRIKAERSKRVLNESGAFGRTIVTEVEPLTNFFPAEKYHQNYYQNNRNQPYCSLIIAPKLQHVFEKYRAWMRE
ncbi:peptide-methionine (S)-S-oxide reductase MsrA [Patescibacteria group bacterium]|nr:peptide-methionine (S)-S-oxide reductase MsrA [Patescibacteria group bacterium]